MNSILSFLNVSNPEKLGCDSGVIFHRLIMGNVAAKEWKVYIASPVDIGVAGAEHIPFQPGENKYEVRYRFDWEEITKILRVTRPKVIMVNQIELVENFRALLLTEGIECKIVTYCHYWPVMEFHEGKNIEWDPSLDHSGLAEGILLRILRAYQTSDLFMVTSHYAASLLEKAIDRYKIEVSERSSVIVNCPADPLFLSEHPELNWDSNRILYNSRLYEQYGTSYLVDLVSALSEASFEFIVTDFFNNRNATRARLDSSVTKYRSILDKFPNVKFVLNGDIRSQYHSEIVSGSFLNFAPHRKNANWSMGAVDCMGLGVPAVASNMASFPEFIPGQLLYNNFDECLSIIKRLRSDKSFYKDMCKLVHKDAQKFASSNVAKAFFQHVENLL